MNRTRIARRSYLPVLGLLVFLLASCDGLGDFGDMNQDPTESAEMTPDYEFTAVQLGTAGSRYEVWRHNLLYTEQIAQHMAYPGAGLGAGSFNSYNADFSGAFWTASYYGGINLANFSATAKNVVNLTTRLQDEPEQVNRLAAARIWKVLVFQRLTDTYGDIPYFEAGKGFLEQEFTPRYTPQDSIYFDMHDELQAAIDQFDASQPTYGSADLVFEGDITQWKKFANSLQLRLALRIKNVEPDLAAQWADEAINSEVGVMEEPDDEVFISHETGPSGGPAGFNTNANSEVLSAFPGASGSPWLSETFVGWMRDRDDPRLPVVAATFVVEDGAMVDVNNDPAQQQGMPIGVTIPELEDPQEDYSRPHPNFRDLDDPFHLQSYAEVEFMLAEVAADPSLGVSTPQSAEQHYEDGVRAAMNMLGRYDDGGATEIAESAIDQYLADNPYDPSQALEQINTQYWAATFLNGLEAWSNWRRSGYPTLEPPDESGDTGGQIIRRLAYPEDEEDLNPENYNEARSRQEISQGTRLTARMWWDVE